MRHLSVHQSRQITVYNLLQVSSKKRHFKLVDGIAIGILYQRRAETRSVRPVGLCRPLIGFGYYYLKIKTYKVNFNTIEKFSEHLRVL